MGILNNAEYDLSRGKAVLALAAFDEFDCLV